MPSGSLPTTATRRPDAAASTASRTGSLAGLADILDYWARRSPDAPFLTFEDLDGVGTRWTYGEFHGAVRHSADRLRALGLRPGDRCVLHTGNSLRFMVALWAVLEAGGVAIPTIAEYAADELRFVVEDSGARAIVCTGDLLRVAEAAAEGLECAVLPESALDGDDVMGPLPAGAAAPTVPASTAIVLYTSGTTSRPKGVMLSHDGLLYTARSFAEHLRLQPADTTLTCLPLFHVNALVLQMLPAILSGGRLVVTPRFSASRFWSWVADHEVTAAHLVAGPIRVLLQSQAGPVAERGHALRFITFGMPLGDGEIEQAQSRFGAPLVMVWGSTETGCGATLMPLDFGHRPGYQCIGPALRGWDVAAVDPESTSHRPLPDGEHGELAVRAPGTMVGYLGQAETTALAVRDGWVHTGDIGWRDTDGYFHFVDRLKDMIKPSGENVAAGEVERVILDHQGVTGCAVVGLPDPIRMEAVVAVVVPAAGTRLTAADIREWCAARLAAFKVPSRVEFRPELPLTSIGKVRKAEVRASLLAPEESA